MENIKIKRCFLVYYEIINYYLNILLNLIIFQIYFHNAILNTLFTFFNFFLGTSFEKKWKQLPLVYHILIIKVYDI